MAKIVLITGAAKRIGAAIAQSLHQQGMNVIVHYNHSQQAADELAQTLNGKRKKSAVALQADFNHQVQTVSLIKRAIETWGQLDALINNASSFFPTPLGEVEESHWDALINSNVKAPFFLCQAAAPYLAKQHGCIINISDIHAQRPLKNYSVYCVAKAALEMLTRSLAKELGPHVRVNAIAPGSILWPESGENSLAEAKKQKIIRRTALKRQGSLADISKAVSFLLNDADYITGQILNVDGG